MGRVGQEGGGTMVTFASHGRWATPESQIHSISWRLMRRLAKCNRVSMIDSAELAGREEPRYYFTNAGRIQTACIPRFLQRRPLSFNVSSMATMDGNGVLSGIGLHFSPDQ